MRSVFRKDRRIIIQHYTTFVKEQRRSIGFAASHAGLSRPPGAHLGTLPEPRLTAIMQLSA